MRINSLLVLGLLAVLVCACTPGDNQDEDQSNTVDIPIDVSTDEVFGFVQGAEIGQAEFSDKAGIVGTRVHCHIHLDDITRFQEETLSGEVTLLNTNAIKAEDYLVEFEIDTTDNDIEFYIPQILTIPTILNFQVTLSYATQDLDGCFAHESGCTGEENTHSLPPD